MHAERCGCDVKKRIVRQGGEQRYIRFVRIPVAEGEALKGFLGTAIDITEQELLTQELERRQAHLTEAQKLANTGSWVLRVSDRNAAHLSEEWYRIYGFDPAEGRQLWKNVSNVSTRRIALSGRALLNGQSWKKPITIRSSVSSYRMDW
jgi:PAS domain-containing protein